jgi:hypothetical protein
VIGWFIITNSDIMITDDLIKEVRALAGKGY